MLTMAQWTLIAVLAQLALAGYELWRIHMGLESKRWPQTTGKIGKAWQEDDFVRDIGDEEGTHSVYARYRYRVDARWYDGRRLSYGVTSRVRFNEALDLLHQLRAGGEVDVYYDPGKPQRAVLYPGSSAGNVVLLATWIVGATLTMALR